MNMFRDSRGRVVVWQVPNKWFIYFLLAYLAALVSPLPMIIAKFFLGWWAYLELSRGVNLFRRLLGAAVLVWLALDILF